jgi:RHS repeat-associated protein
VAAVAKMGYDALGRLSHTNGSVFTYFDYDGTDMTLERANGVGSPIQRRYVHGPGSDEPLVWYEGAGISDRRFPLADERGSIIAITNASGSVTNINAYDEYGIPASSNVGRFGYTGQTWLPEVGMNYYKARIYSPTLGRFLQSDPIGYGDGVNFYNYVGGDPVNGVDPSGLIVRVGNLTCAHGIEADGRGGWRCDDGGGGSSSGGGGGGAAFGNAGGGYRGDPGGLVSDADGGDTEIVVTCDAACVAASRAACPSGSRFSIGAGVSGTLFAFVGLSAGGGVGASVPFASLPIIGDGSFRGTQGGGSLSITPLAGVGAFAGLGPSYSVGYASQAEPFGISSSNSTSFQAGAGDGGGVEASTTLGKSPITQSFSAGPKGAIGIYGAYGRQFNTSYNTQFFGC